MIELVGTTRGILNPPDPSCGAVRLSPRSLVIVFVLFGLGYCVVMGSFTGIGGGKPLQLIFSGVKIPILLGVTFLLCIPSFYVMNSVAGLRNDFPRILRNLLALQGALSIVLFALAPVTAFWYVCTDHYPTAVTVNFLILATSSFIAQFYLRRLYEPLVRSNPRHGWLMWTWLGLYGFVGIQMAWILRPFIGDPGMESSFLRETLWSNAYVRLAELIATTLGL